MSGAQHTHSWSKAFRMRRHQFEQRLEVDPVFEEEEEGPLRRSRDTTKRSRENNSEESTGVRRLRSPTSGRGTPPHSSSSSSSRVLGRSLSSPTAMWPAPTAAHLQDRRRSAENVTRRVPQRPGQRAPFDGNFEDEDDQLAPLGTSPSTINRRPTSSQRMLAIGEETGQKERVVPYCETTSPAFSSQSQSDDSEREDSGLSAQIVILTTQNRKLQQQLREREQERDGLRERLESHQPDTSVRVPYPPPAGLPSRVLDGRKVLRERDTKNDVSTSVQTLGSGGKSFAAARDPRWKNFDEVEGLSERDLLAKLENLKRLNVDLECRLRETSEEKRRAEMELKWQREAFVKAQEREQDLSKDIEVLRDENSHHSGAISKLQVEREGLQTENETLQEELTAASEKLGKTEKCYKEVEHENLSLEAEIEQLMGDKKQLYEEKQKLQSAVEDARKTKENFRSTIRQLREQNVTLEGQLSEVAKERKVATTRQEKTKKIRESKEQQVLSELMTLREERSQLKDKLTSAQQEIDSLECHVKENPLANQVLVEFSANLSEFQTELAAIRNDLKSTKSDALSLSAQHRVVMRDNLMCLAQKSQEMLSVAEHENSRLSNTLERSEASLTKMQTDFHKIKAENAKLLSQKGNVLSDISKLRAEVAALQDQKRLLEVQLAQNDSISQQREDVVLELQSQQKKLQDKLASSERLWKSKLGRFEHEWEGKLAEANTIQGNLLEEQDSLLHEKASLEEQLSRLQQENEELEIAKRELQSQVGSLEGRMEEHLVKMRTNVSQISGAQHSVGRLLAEKACIVAEMTLSKKQYEAKMLASQKEFDRELESAAAESEELKETLSAAEKERNEMKAQLEQISEKATQIDHLTSQLLALTNENTRLKSEMEVLRGKHEMATKDLQQLAETEQSRHLHNEKLKMTLTTEIGLLKSKLKSVEDDKVTLEEKLADLSKERSQTTSAFHAVPESKHIEQLRKQIAALQVSSRDQNAQFGDLQGRSAFLETENMRLKEAARTSKEVLEANTTLRKQLAEMSRNNFFLESEAKRLTDRVHSLQNSLKSARETKERSTNERTQTLLEENQGLQDKIRGIEEDRTKKLMAVDLKIVEAVKENDKLREWLLEIRSGFEGGLRSQSSDLEDLAKSHKAELELLRGMKTSLLRSREDLVQFEVSQQQALALQSEIQQILAVQMSQEVSGRSATLGRSVVSTSSPVLPPVLKSLPPEYLSSLQGRSAQAGSSAASNIPTLELQGKLSHLHTVHVNLVDKLNQHQGLLQRRESEVAVLEQCFTTLEGKLAQLVKQNEGLQQSVASLQEFDLKPDQLQVISFLQKQNEILQDKVIDRDMALQDIELQMKKDYELHDRKFTTLKSQVLESREELSGKDDLLRTKEQYILQTEERILECENQLLNARKDLERALQEREQLMKQGLPDNFQLPAGMTNMSDVIRVQGEELRQLQKVLTEFAFDMSELQAKLDVIAREKSIEQSKCIEMERMHIQMKEALTAEINYLRRPNLQFVDQQMKAEAQETFRKQRDMIKLEAEYDSCKLKIHEQERKISDLERQLVGQNIAIKLLQAEKDHALMHTQDFTNQRAAPYLRPRSAESARKPNYRISDNSKPRGTGSNVLYHAPHFSIMLPTQNSSQGDILNLEESRRAQVTLSLGPMVVTDDEASSGSMMRGSEGKLSRPQRAQKLRNRGHRRTASTGSNIHIHVPPLPKEKETVSAAHFPHPYPAKQKMPKHPRRPGSAGSTRPDVTQITKIKSPEHIKETAQAVTEYMSKLIDDHSPDSTKMSDAVTETREKAESKLAHWGGGGGASGRSSQSGPPSQPGQLGVKSKPPKYSEMTRSKQANKSTDSNETNSSEGASSSKSSNHSDPTTKHSNDSTNQSLPNDSADTISRKLEKPKDLFRTESMSSTGSALSIFGSNLLPSRNHSFVYDGGESSTYSHESLEIGDSVESLQTLGKLGYNPYMLPIRSHHKHETTTSSSDDESIKGRDYWFGRRKRSSGTTVDSSHDTPHYKGDNSNSSGDSDQLQRGSYHANEEPTIPVHRKESISVSDIEKYSTDMEMDDRLASLQKSFGRVRYSSTGSVKICYSESSNTSMEDVSRNV